MDIKDKLKTFSDVRSAQILDSLGLEAKRQPVDFVLPALGIFSAGLVVGAMLGVLFAPKSGHEIRHEIRDRLPRRDSDALPPGLA